MAPRHMLMTSELPAALPRLHARQTFQVDDCCGSMLHNPHHVCMMQHGSSVQHCPHLAELHGNCNGAGDLSSTDPNVCWYAHMVLTADPHLQPPPAVMPAAAGAALEPVDSYDMTPVQVGGFRADALSLFCTWRPRCVALFGGCAAAHSSAGSAAGGKSQCSEAQHRSAKHSAA